MKRPPNILRLADLTGAFAGPTWGAWRAILRALVALPMAPADLATYRELTGRSAPPTAPCREAWLVCGRRAGKSIVAALAAVYAATCRVYKLAPGEVATVAIIAADRRQARVVKGYVLGLIRAAPSLAALVARETTEGVELTNGVNVEIMTASLRTVRGYTIVAAICDEIAFWPTDQAADPDREILAALRPAMATVPGALLLCLSSPYARRGELWRAHRDHYGKDGDPVLIVQAPTLALNATVPQAEIDRAYADDPSSAAAEFGAQFRSDVESFVSRDVIEACVAAGRVELPPVPGIRYVAFVDPSGGSGDSFTLAIGHVERTGATARAVVDCARERRAPFDPEAVVAELARVCASYGARRVTGDRYAGEWPREAFRRHGIGYDCAERAKSDLYRDALAIFNAGRVELPDDARLVAQLVSLERRTARGGRDSIDHPPGGHDDLANVVAGLVSRLLVERAGSRPLVWGSDARESREQVLARRQRRDDESKSLREHAAERRLWGATMRERLERERPADDRLSVPLRVVSREPAPSPVFGGACFDPLQGKGGIDRW